MTTTVNSNMADTSDPLLGDIRFAVAVVWFAAAMTMIDMVKLTAGAIQRSQNFSRDVSDTMALWM